MVNGETHWYDGRRYRLRIVETAGRQRVRLAGGQKMEMSVPARPPAIARRCLTAGTARDSKRRSRPWCRSGHHSSASTRLTGGCDTCERAGDRAGASPAGSG
jgi:hypothetical protein